MTRSKNPLADVNYLLEKTDLLLKRKKKELAPCKKCKQKIKLYAAGKCEKCFLDGRKPKENVNLGKIWQSTDGQMKIYIEDGKGGIKPANYARYLVGLQLGRNLTRNERVLFKDGDTTNCALSNLSLLSDQAIDIVCSNCGHSLSTLSILEGSLPQTPSLQTSHPELEEKSHYSFQNNIPSILGLPQNHSVPESSP